MYVFHWFDESPIVSDPTKWWTLPAFIAFRPILYMHLPDLLSLAVGLLLSTSPKIRLTSLGTDVSMFWTPLACMALILAGTIQMGIASKNLSRLVLSSPLFTILGYCSFSLYLFQYIFLLDYLERIHKATGMKGGYDWRALPLWERFVTVLILITFCYVSQKLFADPVAGYAYPRLKSLITFTPLHFPPTRLRYELTSKENV